MAVMTAQAPLPLSPAGAVEIGEVVALVEEADGSGRVYVRGELASLWGPGDQTGRRLAAVQLVHIKAATGAAVATGFGIGRETLRQWMRAAERAGAAGLVPARPGPKGPSKLTPAKVADIRARRKAGGSLRAVAEAAGVSTDSVRRALVEDADAGVDPSQVAVPVEAEVLAVPPARTAERAAARAGLLEAAEPVLLPAARVPLAGLLLALPALEATGLLSCAEEEYGKLPDGFYGLDTMLLEGVFRALAGAPRAEGAGRFAPTDLGRVLGMDRAPEVKTIRRKIAQLATRGKAAGLLASMAAHHLHRPVAGIGEEQDQDEPDDGQAQVGLVLYVDGHVRAYTGTKKIAKTHSARLRFPAPATVETWVSDAAGDPVLVVMATPGASLAGELRRLLPDLRAAVGDGRRVLVGFDRGGWSPALFAHMHAAGFDVLTWRKGHVADVDAEEFTDLTYLDEAGREHDWSLADTVVELPLGRDEETGEPELFTMRQVTRLDSKKGVVKQVHVLTTRTDLSPAQVVHRMGSRWRVENYFRYARTHLGLDSHDSYAAGPDDPDRSVPNPAKRTAHKVAQSAYARAGREKARAEAGLLAARTPTRSRREATISNQAHNAITAPWHQAEDDLAAARAAHATVPTRIRLGDLAPGQQVLDTETKLIHHAIKIAAFNTTTAIARDVRLHTGYARADQEAYTLTRQVLTHTGDILPDPDAGTLTVRLDPLPTARESAAVAELCEHLTATATTYPGTDLTLRYEIKNRP